MKIRDCKVNKENNDDLDHAQGVESKEKDYGKDDVKDFTPIEVVRRKVGRIVRWRGKDSSIKKVEASPEEEMEDEDAKQDRDIVAEAGVLLVGIVDLSSRDPALGQQPLELGIVWM